jgi:hypothetical protein
MGARALTGRSLAEVKLAQGVQHREQCLVAQFIEELAPGAAIEGHARGIALRVAPVQAGLMIEADRQVLTAVVINLLQNAFKFTRPGTTVVLSATAGPERVLIEVEDECGGLATANLNELFRPSSSGARIERGWAWVWRSVAGASNRTTAESTRAISWARGVSSPSICRASPWPPSPPSNADAPPSNHSRSRAAVSPARGVSGYERTHRMTWPPGGVYSNALLSRFVTAEASSSIDGDQSAGIDRFASKNCRPLVLGLQLRGDREVAQKS